MLVKAAFSVVDGVSTYTGVNVRAAIVHINSGLKLILSAATSSSVVIVFLSLTMMLLIVAIMCSAITKVAL
ncbi:hypothetical protein B0I21_105141 [Sphingobacterium paludis]|uniref:Uncharacterized protein n=1 Tax=Sphingobacterium paludis TaxID=1476465 RepID=A0A4R7CWX3_9SPHI|nr:hypothetical protein B0I21_105141 [Sphingobacterium paludis]